ncbi:MAG TPA: ATP-binding cassette domain-containing protein [Urbifossiella sp.]|nr:ATP-binding cassette domain-containing protein [Urbifossiella sp.]
MIAVEEVTVRQGAFALGSASFTVPAGGYAVLTGPTGAGKTTLLEVLAGLRSPATGRVVLAGRDVTRFPPAARGVGYVPQDAALFRTMTVAENLGFALAVRKTPASEVTARVAALADRLGVSALLGRRADRLSGGEARRVALGRALAFDPPVLLLDEPLTSVDEATRDRLVGLLAEVHSAGSTTVLHVTHAPGEVPFAGHAFRLDAGRVVTA